MKDNELIELILSSLHRYGHNASRRNMDFYITDILEKFKDQNERLMAISSLTELNEDPNICDTFKNNIYEFQNKTMDH